MWWTSSRCDSWAHYCTYTVWTWNEKTNWCNIRHLFQHTRFSFKVLFTPWFFSLQYHKRLSSQHLFKWNLFPCINKSQNISKHINMSQIVVQSLHCVNIASILWLLSNFAQLIFNERRFFCVGIDRNQTIGVNVSIN